MKTIITTTLSATVAAFALISNVRAAEEAATKPVSLEGEATCAKCDLETSEKCKSVLQVKEGDKTITYTLAGKAGGEWHKNICKKAKNVKVTGTVSEKDGEKTLDVTEIEIVKDTKEPAKSDG